MNRNKIKIRWHGRTLAMTPLAVVIVSVAVATGGCGSSATTATGDASAVTLSGTLGSSSGARYAAASFKNDRDAIGRLLPGDASAISSSVDDVAAIYCVTFAMPPAAGTASVAGGAFSVTISGAAGKKLGCFFLDANEETLATMVFKGTSSESDSKSFSGAVGVGAIDINFTTGEAVVDEANITGTVVETAVAAGDAFDMTGDWKFAAIPEADKTTADKGVSDICASNNDPNCHGPSVGFPVHIKRVQGVKADASAGFGLLMWDSSTSFAACGSKLGATYAKLLTDTGIDFTNSGVAEGAFDFATSAVVGGVTHTLTDGWKSNQATASYNYSNCAQGAEGFTCTDPDGTTRVEKSGGCVNSAGIPVKPDSWSGMSSCSQSDPDTDGFITNTCSGTVSVEGTSTAVVCTNVYKESGGTIAGFAWSGPIIAEGALCSSGVTSASVSAAQRDLAAARCYADYYRRTFERSDSGACLKQVESDWTATTAEAAVTISEDAGSMILAGALNYDSSGQVATLYEIRYENRGVSAGANSFVPCRVKSTGSITFVKVSDTKIRGYYVDAQVYAPADKTKIDKACIAEFGSGKSDKFIFYMDKQ